MQKLSFKYGVNSQMNSKIKINHEQTYLFMCFVLKKCVPIDERISVLKCIGMYPEPI